MTDLEEVEKRRQDEQARVDSLMGLAERNRAGQFATPNPLAQEIVRFVASIWPASKPIRFLEPCVGTGSFYSALLRVFPSTLIETAVGYEQNELQSNIARTLWRGTPLEVFAGDFTRQSPPRSKFSLIITNPPYVRHHHLSREDKERLQEVVFERLHLNQSGLSGLYCYFMLLADAWLAEGGLSVWLVPSEFMDVNYGEPIKRYLTHRVKLLHIHRHCPSDSLFDDALVSSAIVVFQKSPPTGHEVTFSFGGSIIKPTESASFRVEELSPREKWTRLHATKPGGRVKTACVVTLGDLFSIRRGLATGSNDYFIIARSEALERGFPEEFLRPILPAPRRLKERVVEAHPDGYPAIEPQLSLIDCRLREDEVRTVHAKLWAYLDEGKQKGVDKSYLASRRRPWYSQEDRPPPPFLCTYMGRTNNGRKPFRFIWNKSRATAHNVYLLLYPKGVLAEILNKQPEMYSRLFEALESIDTNDFVTEGRVYGGGLYKMEPKELANIPADFILDALRGPRRTKQHELFGS